MTTWIENPEGGRESGPRGLLRAGIEVLVRPRRFFRNGVSSGDQAPGLTFGVLVAVVYAATRLAAGATLPSDVPFVAGGGLLAHLFVLLAVAFFVAPAVLHLTAALQTALLMVVAPERGGISETVQVIAYASAPCVLAGLPVAPLRVVCTLYGAVLLVVGLSVRHDLSLPWAAVAGAVPAVFVFGYAFGGLAAATALLGI